MDKEQRISVLLQPGGRYIVEVRDDGTWHATRVQGSDGTPPSAVRLPGVNDYLDRHAQMAAEFKRALGEGG